MCVDMLESMAVFLLDDFSEVADSLAIRNFDWEYATGVITEHQTVEIKCVRHGNCWSTQRKFIQEFRREILKPLQPQSCQKLCDEIPST